MFFTKNLRDKAAQIIAIARIKNLKIATAESCSGGLLSALFTEIAGSSDVFECGFVTYSNEAKTKMLQVKKDLFEKHGAVSAEVALSMAQGAIKNSTAQVAIAITGIAGPGGESNAKPIGLVYIVAINVSHSQRVIMRKFNFCGDRNSVRKASIIAALDELQRAISSYQISE